MSLSFGYVSSSKDSPCPAPASHVTSLTKLFIYANAEDEEAFDILYCIGFAMMDAQWLAMRASYMEFNVLSLSLSLMHDKN